MCRRKSVFKTVALIAAIFLATSAAISKPAFPGDPGAEANGIYGQVWDPYNRPVSDVYVELLTDVYMSVARQKTNGSGRFEFVNIPAGSYKVKVLVTGTDYQEQVQEVQIVNVMRGSSDQQFLDFRLKFDPRKVKTGSTGTVGTVYAQEVPDRARERYRKGAALVAGKDEKGLAEVEKALEIFPDYYEALNFLGTEYVRRREYAKSLPYLIRAIDINQRSFSGYYALGYACYKLDQRPEAIEAARAAVVLNPASVDGQLLYGTVLRIGGSYERSEKALVQAEKLSEKKPVPEIHWQLALLYNKMNRNLEAAEHLETYLKIQPDSVNDKEIKELIGKLRAGKK